MLSSKSESFSRNNNRVYGTQQDVRAGDIQPTDDPLYFNSPQGLSHISRKCTPTPQSSSSQNGGGINGSNGHLNNNNQSYIREFKRILCGFESANFDSQDQQRDHHKDSNIGIQKAIMIPSNHIKYAEQGDILGNAYPHKETVMAGLQTYADVHNIDPNRLRQRSKSDDY